MADKKVNVDISAHDSATPTLNRVKSSFQGLSPAVAGANNTLLATTQVVRDLPFGFMAISNNLPILIDQFQSSARTAGGAAAAFKALGASMLGPAGISFAISAIISAITYYTMNMGKAKDETDKLTETINKLKESMNSMSFQGMVTQRSIDQTALLTMENEIKRREKEIADYKFFNQGNFGAKEFQNVARMEESLKKFKEFNKDAMDTLRQSLKTLDGEISKMGLLPKLRREIELLSKERDMSNDEAKIRDLSNKILKIEDRIKRLTDKVKPKELFKDASIFDDVKAMDYEYMRVRPEAYQPKPVEAPSKPTVDLWGDRDQLNEEFKYLRASIQGTANFMQNAFGDAFKSVIGEANSLFEQLIVSVGNSIMNLFAQDLAQNVFKFLMPGYKGIIDTLFGGGKAAPGRGGDTYLVVDGEVLGKVVRQQLPGAMAGNVRARRIS